MADPFIAEIRAFGFNFPPAGWAYCTGQLLPLSQYTALFSLLGTYYGGDGKSNFALPNLQGTAAIGSGQGPGLSPRDVGESGGSSSVTLLYNEMPYHSHAMLASVSDGTSRLPADNDPATGQGLALYHEPTPSSAQLSGNMLTPQGGGVPHNNMQPYLTMNYCIALQGIYPPRG